MKTKPEILALVPNRKKAICYENRNLRLLRGRTLFEHAIAYALSFDIIDKVILSTDSVEFADIARKLGADVPFIRPHTLADDDSSLWSVVRHALDQVDSSGDIYKYILVLDPTVPTRSKDDLIGAFNLLREHPEADGVVSVSEPAFNPLWLGVKSTYEKIEFIDKNASTYKRRREVPETFEVNSLIQIWTTKFIQSESVSWMNGNILMYKTPKFRSIRLDDKETFDLYETLIENNFFELV